MSQPSMKTVEAGEAAKPAPRDPGKIFPVSWDQFHRDFARARVAIDRGRAI